MVLYSASGIQKNLAGKNVSDSVSRKIGIAKNASLGLSKVGKTLSQEQVKKYIAQKLRGKYEPGREEVYNKDFKLNYYEKKDLKDLFENKEVPLSSEDEKALKKAKIPEEFWPEHGFKGSIHLRNESIKKLQRKLMRNIKGSQMTSEMSHAAHDRGATALRKVNTVGGVKVGYEQLGNLATDTHKDAMVSVHLSSKPHASAKSANTGNNRPGSDITGKNKIAPVTGIHGGANTNFNSTRGGFGLSPGK